MKKFVFFISLILVLLFSVTCYAAPASVNGADAGNITGLVIVKKPETAISSTTKGSYTLSAVSLEGIEISVYGYNYTTGLFDLMHDSAGNPVTTRVGATGLYVHDINLAEGTNYILLRAQYGESLYQNIRLDITLMKQESLDSIRSFAAGFGSMFGW